MNRLTTPGYAVVLAALLFHSQLALLPASAIQLETPTEKQANLKHQLLGELFHRWTFDQQTPEDALSGFSQFIVGGDAPPVRPAGRRA